SYNIPINWPGLHNAILRMPPAVGKAAPYGAVDTFTWLAASGTACLLAAILASIIVGLRPGQFVKVLGDTSRQLVKAELTLAIVLALAFLMNYSGATATLGLAFAATGAMFPFFSAMLGWLGVFLTGSDTSANALFGNLQVVTANKLGMNPILMASSNSSGGVMGKMISLTSVAVAAAATAMKPEDESRLFRFTLKHSVFLASMIGLIVVFYAYIMPALAPYELVGKIRKTLAEARSEAVLRVCRHLRSRDREEAVASRVFQQAPRVCPSLEPERFDRTQPRSSAARAISREKS